MFEQSYEQHARCEHEQRPGTGSLSLAVAAMRFLVGTRNDATQKGHIQVWLRHRDSPNFNIPNVTDPLTSRFPNSSDKSVDCRLQCSRDEGSLAHDMVAWASLDCVAIANLWLGPAKNFSSGYSRNECRRDTKNLAHASVLKAVQSSAFCSSKHEQLRLCSNNLDPMKDLKISCRDCGRETARNPALLQCHKISFCHTDTTTKLVPR